MLKQTKKMWFVVSHPQKLRLGFFLIIPILAEESKTETHMFFSMILFFSH